jgi:acetyl-CoA carboxylase carboxyl transferase subunit alpha
MMEDAVYSVISPEGCASILWKDSTKAPEAAEKLKLTAQDLFDLGVVERVLRQPTAEDKKMFESLKLLICRTFEKNLAVDSEELAKLRYKRFRKLGNR